MHDHMLHGRGNVAGERHRRTVALDLALRADAAIVQHPGECRMDEQLDTRAGRIVVFALDSNDMTDIRRAIAAFVASAQTSHHFVESHQLRFERLLGNHVIVEQSMLSTAAMSPTLRRRTYGTSGILVVRCQNRRLRDSRTSRRKRRRRRFR